MRFPLCEEGGLNKVQSADSDSGSLASAGEYTLELYWVGEQVTLSVREPES